jgi:hypothetical protein
MIMTRYITLDAGFLGLKMDALFDFSIDGS